MTDEQTETPKRRGGRPRKVDPLVTLLNGTPGAAEGAPVPTEPADLGLKGRETWALLWKSRQKMLASPSDLLLIETAANLADEMAFLQRALREGLAPRHYEMPNGAKASHPYVTQLKETRAAYLDTLQTLGTTPAARAKMGELAAENTTGQQLVDTLKRGVDDLRERARQQAASA